jgi:predicted membrane protein
MHRGYKYAIIALILSIVGLLSVFVLIGIPLSIIALYFGIKSWRYYKKEPLPQGKGVALSGILISSFSLLFFILVIAIVFVPNYYLTKSDAGVSRIIATINIFPLP